MEIWQEINTHGDIWEFRIVNGYLYVAYMGNGFSSSTVVG